MSLLNSKVNLKETSFGVRELIFDGIFDEIDFQESDQFAAMGFSKCCNNETVIVKE